MRYFLSVSIIFISGIIYAYEFSLINEKPKFVKWKCGDIVAYSDQERDGIMAKVNGGTTSLKTSDFQLVYPNTTTIAIAKSISDEGLIYDHSKFKNEMEKRRTTKTVEQRLSELESKSK